VREAQAAVHGVGGELERLLPHVQLLALGRVALRLSWVEEGYESEWVVVGGWSGHEMDCLVVG
jgi:hypothetical protein